METKTTCVVLIEDDQAMNYFHQRLFEKQNFADSVLSFTNAAAALNEIQKLKNIMKLSIFLDLNMSQMNGWQFIEALADLKLEQDLQLKLFVLSSSENPNDLLKAKQIPEITDYLTKPLSIEMLNTINTKHS
jgi:CheY-like chemotaxis protein